MLIKPGKTMNFCTLPPMWPQETDQLRLQFEYYKHIGEKAMAQVKEEPRLFWTFYNDSNSIGILVQHLSAHMLHHFSAFYDGERALDPRFREQEFHPFLTGRSEMMHHWEKGWHCVLQLMQSMDAEKLQRPVSTSAGERSAEQVLLLHLAHYAYHVGQIVFLSKMLAIDHWDSLSIPRLRPDDRSGSGNAFFLPQ